MKKIIPQKDNLLQFLLVPDVFCLWKEIDPEKSILV